MEIRKILTGGNKISEEWRADRKSFVAPVIDNTQKINGTRYYFTSDGRQFIADVFDVMFKPPRGRMKHKSYKGRNPAKKVA